jgi:hypothetical protein
MNDNRLPESRVQWALAHAPSKFNLLQFARLYRTQYGHRNKDRDPPAGTYPWKHLAAVLIRLGAQQIGQYAVRETRFVYPPQKETPAPAKPSPAPAAPTTTIERLEARLSELQRVVDLQTKIKEVEAQIALF